jgi:hypothetical protein
MTEIEDEAPHRLGQSTPEGAALASTAREAAKEKSQLIHRLSSANPANNPDVNKVVDASLLGSQGQDKGKHESRGADGKYYPGTTQLTVPEINPQTGKPTGRTIVADKLSNGDLATLLDQTVARYAANETNYKDALAKSGLPQKTLNDQYSDVAQSLKLGSPGGMTDDNFQRLLASPGQLSDADRKLFQNLGPGAIKDFTNLKERLAFDENMKKQGKFFPGKMQLCCCVNGRNKALGMISWATSGSPPENSSCHAMHFENFDLSMLKQKP